MHTILTLDGLRESAAAVLVALAIGTSIGACTSEDPAPEGAESEPAARRAPVALEYTGGATCASCHAEQHARWSGSHHDLAMQEVGADNVLGDFDDARFERDGVVSRFFREDGEYRVRTDGPTGEMETYTVQYVFGIYPLQQYLLELPGGRLQALTIAWDTRSAADGGERWFHLYSDLATPPGDPLHWTGRDHNWNHQCAECHSTNLRKNYRASEDRFDTSWAEIDVACEACHGPGSRHVAWAQSADAQREADGSRKGLVVNLDDRAGASWVMNTETGIAERSVPHQVQQQPEACGRCHARRSVIRPGYRHGRPLMDTHHPAMLRAGLYQPDGQIQDEVYVYGSFLQSAMYRAGVTCSDCHDPHSNELHAEGNAVCAQCHLPQRFDTPEHHHHVPGMACVDCHMPARNYMVVDPRHDHSLRVPRPDITELTGAPNACNGCHEEQDAAWASERVTAWYGARDEAQPHYGIALHAGRTGAAGAADALAKVAADPGQPGIARGTALSLMSNFLSAESLPTVRDALTDDDPFVRLGALDALERIQPDARPELAGALLRDPVRMIRIRAARLLAPAASQLPPDLTPGFTEAAGELVEAELVSADRPESHANLGNFYRDLGEFDRAQRAYETALRIEPDAVGARANLADLYRARSRDEDGERVLREGLARGPDASLEHALGLLLVRRQREAEALEALERSAKLAPEVARYGYVYAIALSSTGDAQRAVEVLRDLHARHPNDREVLWGLATLLRDLGATEDARGYAETLATLAPTDPEVQRLLISLEQP